MKKILYIIRNLIRSDVSTALLERLYKLPRESYRADLFVLDRRGEYISKLPSAVRLARDASDCYDEVAVFAEIGDFEIIGYVSRFGKTRYRILYLFTESGKSVFSFSVKSRYNFNRFRNIADIPFSSYDRIFTQTRSVKAAVLRLAPTLGGRTFILPKTVDIARVERLAKRPGGFSDTDFDGIRIVMDAGGTLSGNGITAIQAAWILRKRGFYFRLYLIGGECGGSRASRSLGRRLKLPLSAYLLGIADCVVSLGDMKNPYPTIVQSDLFIATEHALERRGLLDRLTADPTALCPRDIDTHLEAAINLGKPIVALDTPLLHRRLEYEEDVLLIENDPGVLADGIEYMCEDL